jgi:hypothetical protein
MFPFLTRWKKFEGTPMEAPLTGDAHKESRYRENVREYALAMCLTLPYLPFITKEADKPGYGLFLCIVTSILWK